MGRYNDNTGFSACVSCPLGYVCDVEGLKVGNKCPAGTFGEMINGVTNCTTCPAGTYQPNKGQALCVDCPTGTYNANTTGATSIGACIPCEVGRYASIKRQSNEVCKRQRY